MKTDITIAFDAKRALSNYSGLGSFSRTLLNDIIQTNPSFQYLLFAPNSGKEDLRKEINEDFQFHYAPYRTRLLQDRWRSAGMVKDLKSNHVQLYHGLSGELPQGIRSQNIGSVVTIHDLIFITHPEFYHHIDAMVYLHRFRRTLKEANRIVAISQCTKRDIMKYGAIPEERIDVIYQSIGHIFQKTVDSTMLQGIIQKYNLPDNYILSVGSIEARKNILLVVKALTSLSSVHLVLVGKYTKYTDKVLEFARTQNIASRIHILHNVPTADLPAIYRQARLFVYPSIYEGFGIPIVEAISNHLPVIACTGSCLEEAGGPHNIYVSPTDVSAMRDAITSLLADETRCRAIAGNSFQYIQRFNNTDAASNYIQVYHTILNDEKH